MNLLDALKQQEIDKSIAGNSIQIPLSTDNAFADLLVKQTNGMQIQQQGIPSVESYVQLGMPSDVALNQIHIEELDELQLMGKTTELSNKQINLDNIDMSQTFTSLFENKREDTPVVDMMRKQANNSYNVYAKELITNVFDIPHKKS